MRVQKTGKHRFLKGLAVSMIAVFLLAGCGNHTTDISQNNKIEEQNPVEVNQSQSNPADVSQAKRITLEEAKEIALNQAGVAEKDAVFEDREFDLDDGTPVYELEFRANGIEYEYDVHAETGEILKAETERADVR